MRDKFLDGRPDIAQVLDRIESDKFGHSAITELRQIVNENRHGSTLKQIDDKGYHAILETVFRTVQPDIANLFKAAKTTILRYTSRLTASAALLRAVVEVGLLKIRYRTVKAVIEHISQCLPKANGGYCEPLIADYFKALATLLGHKAHGEHLSPNDWLASVDFCLNCIRDLRETRSSAASEASSRQESLSLRGRVIGVTTHSAELDNSFQSQDSKSYAYPQLQQSNEVIISCLRDLVSFSNAPILKRAKSVTDVILGLIRDHARQMKIQQSSYDIIERVLSHTIASDVALSLNTLSACILLARKPWHRASHQQRESILSIFVQCQILLPHLFEADTDEHIHIHVSAFLEAMQNQYCARKAREQLLMEDLVFAESSDLKPWCRSLHTKAAAIRPGAVKAEEAWCVLRVSADMCGLLEQRAMKAGQTPADEGRDGDAKRQKRQSPIQGLLHDVSSPHHRNRLYTLQVLSFVFDAYQLPNDLLLALVEALISQLSNDDLTVVSWTIFALTSLAVQPHANEKRLKPLWSRVWRLTYRHVASSSTCRVASQALTILLESDLVPYASVIDLVDDLITSISLNGPAECDASATRLWRTLTVIRQREKLTLDSEFSQTVLRWLFSHWSPSRTLNHSRLGQISRDASISSMVGLICLCVGIQPLTIGTSFHSSTGQLSRTQKAASQKFKLCHYLLKDDFGQTVSSNRKQDTGSSIAQKSDASMSTKTPMEPFLNFIGEECSALSMAINDASREGSNSGNPHLICVSMQLLIAGYGILKSGWFDSSLSHRSVQLLDKLRDDLILLLQQHTRRHDLTISFIDYTNVLCSAIRLPHLKNDLMFRGFSAFISSIDQSFWENARLELSANKETQNEGDPLDMDIEFGSQTTQHVETTHLLNTLHDEIEATSSIDSIRHSAVVRLRTLASCRISENTGVTLQTIDVHAMIEYVTSLSREDFMLCWPAISEVIESDLVIPEDDADTLLQYIQQVIVKPYEFENSEMAASICAQTLVVFADAWTRNGSGEIVTTGAELYAWYVSRIHEGPQISHAALWNIARLLLQVLRVSPEYAIRLSLPSARTTLLQILCKGDITTKYAVGNTIAEIFGLYILKQHEAILDDVIETLPNDSVWEEGIAVRLKVLANLAAAWPTLLRSCTYRILETAGNVLRCQDHARISIEYLSGKLGLSGGQELFGLFAPQLLHTWLKVQPLRTIPHGIFGYSSISMLLEDTKDEVVGQVMMNEKKQEFTYLEDHLEKPFKELVVSSFGKTAAYCIARDTAWPPSDDSMGPSTESRLRQLVGKETYAELAKKKFASITANFILRTEQEDQVEKAFSKSYAYSNALKVYQRILAKGHSEKDLPPNQQPHFSSKTIMDQMKHLCNRTNVELKRMWTPSLFIYVFRKIVDTIHPALGSLHTCSTFKKVRMLVSMAGSVVSDGYPLHMTMHALRPYSTNAECTEECVGLLRYLIEEGSAYLKEVPSFLLGHVISTLLDMRDFLHSRHDSTTQESLFQATLSKARGYSQWLTSYASTYQSRHLSLDTAKRFKAIINAARNLKDRGNAKIGTYESDLLISLLEGRGSTDILLSTTCRNTILNFLGRNFEVPTSFREDVLGDDSKAAEFANAIFATCRSKAAQPAYLKWAARVIGRTYASHGLNDISVVDEVGIALPNGEMADSSSRSLFSSRLGILRLICDLLSSERHRDVGLAEQALMLVVTAAHSIQYGGECEKSLEPYIYRAMLCSDYSMVEPQTVDETDDFANIANGLVASSKTIDAETWIQKLAQALVNIETEDPLMIALRRMLGQSKELAKAAFPFILHMTLLSEKEGFEGSKAIISTLCRSIFADANQEGSNLEVVRSLLAAIIYLRTQALPHEVVKSDRIGWLDLDIRQAARAADCCSMFKTSLLMLEVDQSEKAKTEAVSCRRSRNHRGPTNLPNAMLLRIYQNLDEKDAFYGVNQTPSLLSVMSQLEYEQTGFKSLSFQSAFFDCHIRMTHGGVNLHQSRMMQSLSSMSFHGLSHCLSATATESIPDAFEATLVSSRRLERWDLVPPGSYKNDTGSVFTAFRKISSAKQRSQVFEALDSGLLDCLERLIHPRTTGNSTHASLAALAVLTEAEEVYSSEGSGQLEEVMTRYQKRDDSMDMQEYDRVKTIHSCRETTLSSLNKNPMLRDLLKISQREGGLMECRTLLASAATSREHGALQDALTSAIYLSHLAEQYESFGIHVQAASIFENAQVLWSQGERTAAVRLLVDLHQRLDSGTLPPQILEVGKPGLLAKLGHHTAEARLEKPDLIIENILKEAVRELGQSRSGNEAAEVFHEFASFCDQQLQNADSLADFKRLQKLREQKHTEVKDLDRMIKAASHPKERENLKSHRNKAKQWFDLDDKEYRRLEASRETLIEHSLENYLNSLRASEKYGNDALRFSTMWLENNENDLANTVVATHMPQVPSRHFARLMNQWTSRLLDKRNLFQDLLFDTIVRICVDHPYHSMYQIFASSKTKGGKDETALARHAAATNVVEELKNTPQAQRLWLSIHNMSVTFVRFAQERLDDPSVKPGAKISLRKSQTGTRVEQDALKIKIPPPTMTVELRADCDYSQVTTIAKFQSEFSVATGISMPKIVTALGTDGRKYKQLFKSGNDDLRQDAIMEQVFGAVSSLLRTQRATRQRDLQIRTYKVLPLTATAGVIEFVPNTIPLHDYLLPAHQRHYPKDLKPNACRKHIHEAQGASKDHRIKQFQKVCEQFHPVFRYFFQERYESPDDWYAKRLAYTRSTAAISILGHVLGLGDRHGHNILLDEGTGEVVHIDLGIAFEQGRVLPVPEVVPFRLTRDLVDGMGITGTEGVFRRCCEFTLEALRVESYAIMSILGVLRYDPLYSWSLSPLRLKKMQDAQTENTALPLEGAGVNARVEEEAGEADRALMVVSKKLSPTLSVQATVNELIQQATDEKNLAVLFCGWAAYA